jgi:heat shock protein HslJ
MSDPNYSGILLTVEKNTLSVVPGATQELPVILKNNGTSPEQVRVMVEGVPLPWISTDRPVLLVQPGEEVCITLVIHPPEPPNANAGRYQMRILVTSTLDPERSSETLVALTVAGFEVPGRVGVLLNGLQYAVIPGDTLAVPVVITNQGLGTDIFHLELEGLPPNWIGSRPSAWTLKAGETVTGVLAIQPPRASTSRAGRYQFRILVKSEHAPEQNVSINCILTVGAFIEVNAQLLASDPERSLPARVQILNQSNVPASVQIGWENPEKTLAFEPSEPKQVSLALEESNDVEYKVRPLQRYWVGNEREHPYTVSVQATGGNEQTLRGVVRQKAVMPPWLAAAGGIFLLLCCFFGAGGLLFQSGFLSRSTATLTATTTPLPTATQSGVDQRVLLVDRSWFLISYNNSNSMPGSQEPFTRFNQDGTLLGFTGCKNFNGAYQTEFNRLTISSINLSSGSCPSQSLQVQEDMMVAILRSARSYLVADTSLQITGDAGFLNYSLTPPVRPQEIPPPQAVIQGPSQAQVGQIVVFDGSQSTGQSPIVSWQWQFGDGRNASGMIVQHAFAAPGTFAVQLTVTDQRGQTNTATSQILILPPPTGVPTQTPLPTATLPPPPTNQPPVPPTATNVPPPTATPQPEIVPPQVSINAPSSGYIGEPVKIDASGSRPGNSPIVSYTWSFGNGTGQPASPNPTITATYNTTGMYEITVVVADSNGQTSSASAIITINARLDTRAWTLSTINGQPLLPGSAITLQFLSGQLAGFAGCNDYNGSYTAVDNGDGTFGVTIDRLTTGRRSCPQDVMTQEDNFTKLMQTATSAAIQENRLTLSGPNGQLVFYLITGP